jgi:hypothetical protein
LFLVQIQVQHSHSISPQEPNTTPNLNHRGISNALSPLTGHPSHSFSRGSSTEEINGGGGREIREGCESSEKDKPDLLKGSMVSVSVVPSTKSTSALQKRLSIANMKNDSIILSENQARYKVYA